MTTHPLSQDQTVLPPNRLLATALRLFDQAFTADPSNDDLPKSPALHDCNIKAVDALALTMQGGAMGG